MYSTNIRPSSSVIGSLPLINPSPEIHRVAMVHMIYIMLTSYRGKISTYILVLQSITTV